MLTVEPDAVTGVTGDCDGFVTIVVFVVTKLGERLGEPAEEPVEDPAEGCQREGQLLTRVALVNIGCQWISW